MYGPAGALQKATDFISRELLLSKCVNTSERKEDELSASSLGTETYTTTVIPSVDWCLACPCHRVQVMGQVSTPVGQRCAHNADTCVAGTSKSNNILNDSCNCSCGCKVESLRWLSITMVFGRRNRGRKKKSMH